MTKKGSGTKKHIEVKYKCTKCGVKAHSHRPSSPVPMFYSGQYERTADQLQCKHDWEMIGGGTG